MADPEHPGARALRGFADFQPGETGALGSVDLEREAIVSFAAAFDPQPFHLDEAAGKASPLGGLAASGWHTASLTMRLIAENLLAGAKSMGAGRIFDLKWLRPVLVGDTLTADYEVIGVRPSSRGDRGYVETRFTGRNQRGEPVITMSSILIIGA